MMNTFIAKTSNSKEKTAPIYLVGLSLIPISMKKKEKKIENKDLSIKRKSIYRSWLVKGIIKIISYLINQCDKL